MFTLTIVALVAVPLLTILLQLLYGPGDTATHIFTNLLPDYILNSLYLLVGCILMTSLIGISSAWYVSRYKLRYSKIFEWLLILPLALPSYITAYAYAGIFDYGGSLAKIFDLFGTNSQRIDIMNLPGLVFVLSISLFPYVYVVARSFFLYQSRTLLEASKLLGVKESKTFFKIILPLARPAIVGGLILVAMEVLNDYGAAKYYGISTFTTGIFRTWFSLQDPKSATYLCALLLLVIFALIGMEKRQRRNTHYELSSKDNFILLKKKPSKKLHILLFFILGTPILLGFILPVTQLVYWSMLTFKSVATVEFAGIALQSFGIAFVGSLLTVIVALAIIYLPKWNPIIWLRESAQIATIGYAIPGAVLAIGVMIPMIILDQWMINFLKNNFDMVTGFIINGTIIALVYAYVIRFLAVAFNPLSSNQLKIGEALSESSRILGKGRLATFLKIDLPLLRPAIIGAFILVFIDIMKELPITLILKPYDVQTLAVKAYEYASDELILEASLPALCIVVTGILPVVLLNRFILDDRKQVKG